MKQTLKKIVITALSWEAKMVIRKYKPKIVAITGSVGKTSTKDAIYTALAPYVHVRRSEKSYNSEMGVPLSILGLPNGWNNPFLWLRNIAMGFWTIVFPHTYPEWLVLEIGADKPGDIKELTQWLKPDVAVMTRFPDVPVHIEFFESKEHVIEEKTYLAQALRPDGMLVINGDDPLVLELGRKYGAQTIVYGTKEIFPVRAKDLRWNYVTEHDVVVPRGREWTLVTPQTHYIVSMPHIIGESHISAALAACAVVYGLGFPLEKAVAALGEYRTPPGRLSLLSGKNGSTIIDDTYNSSPVAAESAVELLRELKASGKKIAIFGDMMELGKWSKDAHHSIGQKLVGACDLLITVGVRSEEIDIGAREAGFDASAIRHFDTALQAGDLLAGMLAPGDIVLAKASQSIRLEKAVKMLLEDPAKDSHLLVRQEKEWEGR